MNKKMIFGLTILLLLSALFSGCLEKSDSIGKNQGFIKNLPPIAKIIAPAQAYFEEIVKFDASDSYDLDGEIKSYIWDFGNGEKAQGKKVSYSYRFEDNFDTEYPIIYPVTLIIKDNDENLIATIHQIKISPKEYIFYLSTGKLTTEKPLSNKEKIGILSYELDKFVKVQKCKWNATLVLEKPLLVIVKKISIIFYDNKGNEITKKDERLGVNIIWREKTVQLNGEIIDETDFKSLKLELNSFSLVKKTNILYGGEKASYICFNFAN